MSSGTSIGPGNTTAAGTTFAYTLPGYTYGSVGYYQTYSGPDESCYKNNCSYYYQHNNVTAYGDVFNGTYNAYGTTGNNLFLPLAAVSSGETLYGWAELTISGGGNANPYSMVLDAIGYDTTGAPVAAGAPVPLPPSLPLLAVGASALALFRRRNSRVECAA